jgi:hypothetical protein
MRRMRLERTYSTESLASIASRDISKTKKGSNLQVTGHCYREFLPK